MKKHAIDSMSLRLRLTVFVEIEYFHLQDEIQTVATSRSAFIEY